MAVYMKRLFGVAAFYGPKLDVEVKPAVGNEVTLSTCQLDFLLPRRFGLTYIDRDGERGYRSLFIGLYLVLLIGLQRSY